VVVVKTVEERIDEHLRLNARYISDKCNPIIKMTAEATERTIKAAPHDVNKLLTEIALKQKVLIMKFDLQSVQSSGQSLMH
jgi:hypothetical protein